MIRKTLLALSLTTAATVGLSTPAQATWGNWGHKHSCGCGHAAGKKLCGGSTSTSSSTSGGTTTTSGGTTTTSGGTTTTSGGTTSGGTTSGGTTTSTSGGTSGGSSGGTAVPEPGMLGMLGVGLLGLAYARRRKARA